MLRQLGSLETPVCLRIQTQKENWNLINWGSQAGGRCLMTSMGNACHSWSWVTRLSLCRTCITALLTYSIVQSPSWEANWLATRKEIPRISRNPKVHYCTPKRPPPVSILGQPNPVHIPTSHLLEIHIWMDLQEVGCILTETYCGFPHSFQVNAEMLPWHGLQPIFSTNALTDHV